MIGASARRCSSPNCSTIDHNQVRLLKADQPSRNRMTRLAASAAGRARGRNERSSSALTP